MLYQIFVQGIGVVAVLCTIIAVQFNSHIKIMFFKTLSELLFAVQLVLLGSMTGAVMNFVGIIRNVIFVIVVRKNKSITPWIIVFMIVTLASGITTAVLSFNSTLNNLYSKYNLYFIAIILVILVSILPITAKTLTTIGYAKKNPHKLRMLNLPSCLCWLTHDIIIFSIAGILNNVFNVCSIIVAEIRYRKIKFEDEEKSGSN